MTLPATKSTDALRPLFLGHTWIEDSISKYRQGNRQLAFLKGRKVMFSNRHFAAALMHIYVGTFSFGQIADMLSIPRAELAFLRTQIDFMVLVDSLKGNFARYFRESLILNEYPPTNYSSIAAEYATFEELARNQIRVPLFKVMKQLANAISDKERSHLPVELYDLQSFKKLFSFFVFEERFLPTLAKPSFEQFKQIAKEIVWNRLRDDYDELDCLVSGDFVSWRVRDELKKLLMSVNLY